MKILVLGGSGFIGTNIVLKLSENDFNEITIADKTKNSFEATKKAQLQRVSFIKLDFNENTDFDVLLRNYDVVYHLISSTVPVTSNQKIAEEITTNIVATTKMLESCVRMGVKKIVFLSSGGTVYGMKGNCPLNEDMDTNPISSYGIQKVTIEKLLYLYYYQYGLDYRIIRLANPYGPYQRPDGVLGAVTTFTYKALKGEQITVYGNGNVIRDFIYIEDAVNAILNIVNGESQYRIFNLGCGYGTSIRQVLETIKKVTDCKLNIIYKEERKVDVPINVLDIGRYEAVYGKLNPINLSEGIKRTVDFMKKTYLLQ